MVSLRCNIDKVAAIVGAVASLWMITIGAIYDRAGFLTLGVLIMSSCLIWLLMRGNAPFEFQFPVIRTNFLFVVDMLLSSIRLKCPFYLLSPTYI